VVAVLSPRTALPKGPSMIWNTCLSQSFSESNNSTGPAKSVASHGLPATMFSTAFPDIPAGSAGQDVDSDCCTVLVPPTGRNVPTRPHRDSPFTALGEPLREPFHPGVPDS
jgi:hypothetical protein